MKPFDGRRESAIQRIELRIEYEDPDRGRRPWIIPVIDGEDLRDCLHAILSPGTPPPVHRSHGGIPVTPFGPPLAHHYLARRGAPFESGRLPVLGCACGIVDCWPFLARIVVDEDFVVWEDFSQGREAECYAALGPFRFDRGEYEAELERIEAWRRTWR